MLFSRPRIIALLVAAGALAAAACRGDKRPETADSSLARTSPTVPASAPHANTGWNDAEAGTVMLLSSPETVNQASIILPFATDSSDKSDGFARADSVRGTEFDLFDRSGKTSLATLSSVSHTSANEGCSAWPTGAFLEPPTRSWRVGFSYKTANPLVLDSLEAASSADSVSMTTELARLSSMVTAAGDPSFQGLPFTVREAYRIRTQDAVALIGDVVRTINEEANPREEHLLLIAEKASQASEYRTAFYSRAAGSEEKVRTTEVLTAIQFAKTSRAAIVVSFEYEDGGRIALVERTAPGVWKLVWKSAYTGC